MNARSENALAEGVVVGASALMMILGVNHFLIGLAALFQDTVFVRTGGYLYELDLTRWGWIHLLMGVAQAALGGFILAGRKWARMLGIGVICLAVVLDMLWLPYAPVWTGLQIAIGVFAIWALATWSPRRKLI